MHLHPNKGSQVSLPQENVFFSKTGHCWLLLEGLKDKQRWSYTWFWMRGGASRLHASEKLKVSTRQGSLIMDREFNPVAGWRLLSPLRSAGGGSRSGRAPCTCQEWALFLEDTDDIIHQAEREALEEWRRDNAGSFEKDDGCQPSEHMKCFLGSIELLSPLSPQVCCQARDSRISKKIQVGDSIMDVVIVPLFCWINWCRKAACFFEVFNCSTGICLGG